jgi:nucleoside-triphosphatase THEP1
MDKSPVVIVVSGEVGIGKSTVCKKVLALAREAGYRCGGIITEKMPGDSLSVVNVATGETEVLAIPGDRYGGPLAPRFTFVPEGIDFGIRAMEEGREADILFVDEIGILEAMGEGFIRAFDIVNEGKIPASILVIRRELLEYLLPGLEDEPVVFETTEDNREGLPSEIVARLPGLVSLP